MYSTEVNNPEIRAAILKEIQPLYTAREAEIHADGKHGEEFIQNLYESWVERINDSDSWGDLGDDGIGQDYEDRIDLQIELARSAVEGVCWSSEIARVWTDLRGWEYDGEVEDFSGKADSYDSINRMNVCLTLLAERYLNQLHEFASIVEKESK